MVTFENGMDIRCREVPSAQVARFKVSSDTFAFVIIGTQYGYIHTSGGDVRTWKTAKGARRFLRSYTPL
jgi:hypothetical protein